jgi:hypothetical protein
MKLVAVAKKTGHLLVVIPLYARDEEINLEFGSENNWRVLARTELEDPLAYVIDIGDRAEVHGPIVLKYIEILGEL